MSLFRRSYEGKRRSRNGFSWSQAIFFFLILWFFVSVLMLFINISVDSLQTNTEEKKKTQNLHQNEQIELMNSLNLCKNFSCITVHDYSPNTIDKDYTISRLYRPQLVSFESVKFPDFFIHSYLYGSEYTDVYKHLSTKNSVRTQKYKMLTTFEMFFLEDLCKNIQVINQQYGNIYLDKNMCLNISDVFLLKSVISIPSVSNMTNIFMKTEKSIFNDIFEGYFLFSTNGRVYMKLFTPELFKTINFYLFKIILENKDEKKIKLFPYNIQTLDTIVCVGPSKSLILKTQNRQISLSQCEFYLRKSNIQPIMTRDGDLRMLPTSQSTFLQHFTFGEDKKNTKMLLPLIDVTNMLYYINMENMKKIENIKNCQNCEFPHIRIEDIKNIYCVFTYKNAHAELFSQFIRTLFSSIIEENISENISENNIQKNILSVHALQLEHHGEGRVKTDKWFEAIRLQARYWTEVVKINLNKNDNIKAVVCSDVDIQYFPKWREAVVRCLKNNDICFQTEHPMNTGFFAMRINTRVLTFWSTVEHDLVANKKGRFNVSVKNILAASDELAHLKWSTYPTYEVQRGSGSSHEKLVVHHAASIADPIKKVRVLNRLRSKQYRTSINSIKKKETDKLVNTPVIVIGLEEHDSLCSYFLIYKKKEKNLEKIKKYNNKISKKCPKLFESINITNSQIVNKLAFVMNEKIKSKNDKKYII